MEADRSGGCSFIPGARAHGGCAAGVVMPIQQLASDVNDAEEAELRRLEGGAPPPAAAPTLQPPPPAKRPRTAPAQAAADELLFSEAALRGKEAGAPLGRLELRRLSSGAAVVRWRPDKGGVATEVDTVAIKEIQNSKREKKMAMIRLTVWGGPPPPPCYIFNFLVGGSGAFDANFEAMMRFKDTLQPLLTKPDPATTSAGAPPVAATGRPGPSQPPSASSSSSATAAAAAAVGGPRVKREYDVPTAGGGGGGGLQLKDLESQACLEADPELAATYRMLVVQSGALIEAEFEP